MLEAGCDEAGRGCLAGPVFAAAVILPDGYVNELLNDSKKLTEKQREQLRPIIERDAVAWAVASCDHAEIDSINILNASILAMHPAGEGRAKYGNIAAASILAKTHRDEFMRQVAKQYPGYNWEVNKGYPTRDHRAAIAEIGPSPFHRMTFRLLP